MPRSALLRSPHTRAYLGRTLAELVPYSIAALDNDDTVRRIYLYINITHTVFTILIETLMNIAGADHRRRQSAAVARRRLVARIDLLSNSRHSGSLSYHCSHTRICIRHI
jgi:hypothetical protein